MKKLNTKGFSVAEVLVVLLIVGIICAVGWLVYDRQKDMSNEQPKTQDAAQMQQTNPNETDDDIYDNWKTYTSKSGGFSLKYPDDWHISGYNGSTSVSASNLKGDEDQIRIVEKNESTNSTDNFGIDISISASPGIATPYNTYPNGTTELLPNGITLWLEKENVTYATGPAKTVCPAIRIGKDSTYSSRLENGKYLSFYGSFCWGQGMKSTMSYEQQVSSEQWESAISIVKSINY